MNYHPIMIAAHIQQTTASATRRRKSHVGPWAVFAVLSLIALAAVLVGVSL